MRTITRELEIAQRKIRGAERHRTNNRKNKTYSYEGYLEYLRKKASQQA